MKPVVIMVGADKGGVGKTTVTRTLLDYLAAKNVLTRAFDAEWPRGTLQRFHPTITEVVDVTTAVSPAQPVVVPAGANIPVTVTNTYTSVLGSLTVVKETAGLAEFRGSVTIAVDCIPPAGEPVTASRTFSVALCGPSTTTLSGVSV